MPTMQEAVAVGDEVGVGGVPDTLVKATKAVSGVLQNANEVGPGVSRERDRFESGDL
jgi:hypothetical protein